MDSKVLNEMDKGKCLIMTYNPFVSRPETFTKLIEDYGCANYRTPYYPDMDKFKPFRYFLVIFAKSGSNGAITHWGIVDRTKSDRTDSFDKYESYYELAYSLAGDPEEKSFRSYFHFLQICDFDSTLSVSGFKLLRTGVPITSLRLLRNILYAEFPRELLILIDKSRGNRA